MNDPYSIEIAMRGMKTSNIVSVDVRLCLNLSLVVISYSTLWRNISIDVIHLRQNGRIRDVDSE